MVWFFGVLGWRCLSCNVSQKGWIQKWFSEQNERLRTFWCWSLFCSLLFEYQASVELPPATKEKPPNKTNSGWLWVRKKQKQTKGGEIESSDLAFALYPWAEPRKADYTSFFKLEAQVHVFSKDAVWSVGVEPNKGVSPPRSLGGVLLPH